MPRSGPSRIAFGLFWAAFVPLLLAGCGQSLAGEQAPRFELTNQQGETTALNQLRGSVVALTFVYTSCPRTCPLYISRIHQAISELEDPAPAQVAVLAVTVDPDRDTVERLREFSSHLSDWFFLTGTPGQLRNTWDNYGVSVEKVPARDGHAESEHYEVAHTAKVVLIDKAGNVAAQLRGEWSAQQLADKLKLLVAGEKVASGTTILEGLVSFIYRCGPVTISTLVGAVGHFLFMLTIPVVLLALYRFMVR